MRASIITMMDQRINGSVVYVPGSVSASGTTLHLCLASYLQLYSLIFIIKQQFSSHVHVVYSLSAVFLTS